MANGTIAFDTLQTSGQITGTAKSLDTDYVVNGSAKCWIRFNASTATSASTFNITSLTDDGTGDFTITIANDFSDANFVQLSSGNEFNTLNDGANGAGTMQFGNFDNSGSRTDTARCFAAGLGDLA